MIKHYKIADFILEIDSQKDYEDEAPLNRFLTDEKRCDFKCSVKVVDSIEKPDDKPVYKTPQKTVIIKDSITYVYYYFMESSLGLNDIFACRSFKAGAKENEIRIVKEKQDKIDSRLILWLLGIDEIACEMNTGLFHSSYVNVNGKALIFTGPSGMGKSTQADLWNKYRNAQIVNGDKALLYIKDGKAFAGGLPFSGSSEFCENLDLPILAIISLGQAKKNTAREESGIKSAMTVLNSCYPVPYSKEYLEKQMDFAEAFSKKVRVLSFECLPNKSAVEFLEEMLCQKQSL